MQEHFDSNPEDIISVIGPSICSACYEVGEEVAVEFLNAFPKDGNNKIIQNNKNGKYQCDLWAANQAVLEQVYFRISTLVEYVPLAIGFIVSHRKTGGKRYLAAFLAIK